MLLFILLFLFSCCPKLIYTDPQGPVFKAKFTSGLKQTPDTLKVVSFNIEYGEKIDQAIHELKFAPEIQNAHIILLQEMDEKGTEKIAKALQMNYVYYPAAVHTYGRNFGEAVLSKGLIVNEYKVILPHRNPICHQKRIVTMAVIETGTVRILAGSMHLEVNTLSVEKRIDQANAVLDAVPDSINQVILGGDYNTLVQNTIDSLDIMVEKAGYQRATTDIDYTIESSPFGWLKLNLDHIYVKGFIPVNSGVYKESKASDHFPVWTRLKLKSE
jgi:endonuclease/exonuclease/phosphatase family metal-dependent hydrolase